ncbi:MAG TPA: response regulator [Acidobacteriota bacterium]|nr:response regulator [Acidobacteriota bacterium]
MTNSRILIIEDDRFLRRACEVSLKKKGYAVLTAMDGFEGLQLARSGSPDLILLDMLMPKLTGIETLEALKADHETRDIPVVILSNSFIEADVQRAKALGALGYLIKASLSLQEMGERVADFLEKAGKNPSRFE